MVSLWQLIIWTAPPSARLIPFSELSAALWICWQHMRQTTKRRPISRRSTSSLEGAQSK